MNKDLVISYLFIICRLYILQVKKKQPSRYFFSLCYQGFQSSGSVYQSLHTESQTYSLTSHIALSLNQTNVIISFSFFEQSQKALNYLMQSPTQETTKQGIDDYFDVWLITKVAITQEPPRRFSIRSRRNIWKRNPSIIRLQHRVLYAFSLYSFLHLNHSVVFTSKSSLLLI